MMPEQPDENKLASYLLGALGEAETERFDELSVSDDVFADRLKAVENDLVDAYARGELTGKRLDGFKAHYLASPQRREKVRFAQTFLGLTDLKAELQAEGATSKDQRSGGRFRQVSWWQRPLAPRLVWVAAAVILLAGGAFLAYQNLRLRNQINAQESERRILAEREQDLTRQLAEQQTNSSKTAQELAEVRGRLSQLEEETPTTKSAKAQGENFGEKVLALTLAPPMRGSGLPPALTLTEKTRSVEVRLELEANEFPLYRVLLKEPATGRTIWRSGTLRAGRKGGTSIVVIQLPAKGLKQQHYYLELSGISTSGSVEILASYPFSVLIKNRV